MPKPLAAMNDADEVTVDAAIDRIENRIEVRGAVYRPGVYQLDGTVNTVKALITMLSRASAMRMISKP